MRHLTRYVFVQLCLATFFVTMALTFAVWLTQSLRFLDYIVNRGLPATTFLSFVAYLIPTFVGVVLPIACFVSVLFIYNKLLGDSELVVMRSAGLSNLQLAKPALLAALICTVLSYSVTLYFQPVSYRAFKDLQFSIRHNYADILLQEGEFSSFSDDITVYVRERSAQGQILGILVHDTRNPEKPVTLLAERGALLTEGDAPSVFLQNGNRQEIDRTTNSISLLHFDSYTIELSDFREEVPYRWISPTERFLPELLWPDDSRADRRFYNRLVAEGHARLTLPLFALTFTFVALAALLAGQFNRQGQLMRIGAAIVVVVGLEALSLAINDLANKQIEAVAFLYLLVLVPVLLGWRSIGAKRLPYRKEFKPKLAEGRS